VTDEGGRFLFYSHDGLGLGHARRNLAIAHALSRLSPRSLVLLATSADEVERLGVPANVDLLRLPAVRKIENGHYESRRLRLPWEEIRAVRSHLLAAAVESFRPAVLLADKHPLGAGGELEAALEVARTSGSRALLGLRDILDDPAAVRAEWAAPALSARIPDYYDRVLVYGQPGVGIPVREYGLPDEIERMTFFCGYVFGPSEESPSGTEASGSISAAGPGPLVLATAGGGEDGFQLLESFIQAAAGARWRAIVVAGPQCGEDDRRLLSTLAADAGVTFRTFMPGLAALFSKVDALVCMGGYNTLVEAAAAGTPTVCVPRVRPRREQLLRGQAFARLGLVQVLDQDPVEPTVLRAEVESMLEVSRATLRERAHAALVLDGAPRAARHLLEVAGHGGGRCRAVAGAFTA
jgi:predicted glycosyltransferase